MSTIKLRRGNNANLPAGGTEAGEPRFSIDTGQLFIDDGTKNVEVTPNAENVAVTGAFMKASDDLDDVNPGATNVHFTATEKSKLAEIEEGAQVNDVSAADIADFETSTELDARDTANRSRANHTGEQPVSSITGLQDQLYALDQDIAGKSPLYHQHQNSDDIKINQGGTLTEVVDVFLESLDTKANNSDVVHTTGDQSVAGVKTFTSSPVVPTPTTDMQVATKKYVDDGLSTKADTSHTHAQSDITNLTTDLAGKQDTLVSGTNIKTINGSSLLGSGDLAVSGGGGSSEEPQSTMDLTVHHSAIEAASGGFTTKVGATTSIATSGGLHVQTGATDDRAYSNYSGSSHPLFFDRVLHMKHVVGRVPNPGTNVIWFLRTGSTSISDTIWTGKGHSFYIAQSANLYAQNANGSAETKTDVAASITTNSNTIQQLTIVHTPATNVKFYNGNMLLATHTTNLPTGSGNMNSIAFVRAKSSANQETRFASSSIKMYF